MKRATYRKKISSDHGFIAKLAFSHHYLFVFLTGSQSKAMKEIKSAMNAWTSKTKGCIKFIQRTNESAYVSFFRGSGYVSFSVPISS